MERLWINIKFKDYDKSKMRNIARIFEELVGKSIIGSYSVTGNTCLKDYHFQVSTISQNYKHIEGIVNGNKNGKSPRIEIRGLNEKW